MKQNRVAHKAKFREPVAASPTEVRRMPIGTLVWVPDTRDIRAHQTPLLARRMRHGKHKGKLIAVIGCNFMGQTTIISLVYLTEEEATLASYRGAIRELNFYIDELAKAKDAESEAIEDWTNASRGSKARFAKWRDDAIEERKRTAAGLARIKSKIKSFEKAWSD